MMGDLDSAFRGVYRQLALETRHVHNMIAYVPSDIASAVSEVTASCQAFNVYWLADLSS